MSNDLQEFLFSIFDLTQEEKTIFREAMTHSSNGILPEYCPIIKGLLFLEIRC